MTQFYKLLAADLCHHDFTYKEGLNVDTVPFNPRGECAPGGLYYTEFWHLPRWYCHGWPLIADVTIPTDARVYAERCGTKWKADQLVLSNIRPLEEFLATLHKYTLYRFITKNAVMLQRVISEAVCLAAVEADWSVFVYVYHQTEAICLAAVRRHGRALFYVQKQTEAICRAAVAEDPGARQYVKIPIDF
jgi:hypothetical protein